MGAPSSISLPRGVRDILPEESKAVCEAASAILSVFEKRGYTRVITPLLEYVDVLSLGMGPEAKQSLLKFIDPSTGRVVAIRPDITPQIARMAATRMRDHTLPLKLCYNENVLRYARDAGRVSSEVLQAGAEQISAGPAPEIDAEMICMAVEALKKLGLTGFKIDVGDVGFLRTLLSRLETDEAGRTQVMEAVARKDAGGVSSALKPMGSKINDADRELLENLPGFYGEEDVIEKAISLSRDEAALASLDYLKRVVDMVCSRGYKESVTVDLGEVRGFDYYTGIIFEGFAPGVGKPILGGGRYDTLMEKYGCRAAATGFAFDVGNIVAAMERRTA